MSNNTLAALPWALITAQPSDVREVPEFERDALIISAVRVDGQWIIISRYGDDIWKLDGFTSNTSSGEKRLNFDRVPPALRVVVKAMLYRYLRRGRRESGQPKGSAARHLFDDVMPFLRHIEKLKLDRLSAVTPMICSTYVTACKAFRQSKKHNGKPLSPAGLQARFNGVEAVHELSQYTDDPMTEHPWLGSSARALAGLIGNVQGKTPLIPDDVFCALFRRSNQLIESGQRLLDLRDTLDATAPQRKGLSPYTVTRYKQRHLAIHGWEGGLKAFNRAVLDLRTACYIILASTSGCRNHELANLQSGAHHRTRDDDGTICHWMRSRSDKTDTGIHDWMIPEVAVRALRLMERWSSPYQAMIGTEIMLLRNINPHDPQIMEANEHRHALFIGVYSNGGNQVRTLSRTSWDLILKNFAKDCGLNWNLSSHQFRRKFANYAAHSRFGDLRYLKEHYAHWSMDMTLGYAMDDKWGQHLDLDLYADIEEELEDVKFCVVDNWMEDHPLAGGYGQALDQWRREPKNLLIFKDRASMVKSIAESTAIRSNGHAWCTADNDGCVGNTLDRNRCGGCNHAVIDARHVPIYLRQYNDLKELLHCQDIGKGGHQRVERDLQRCRDVLIQLGMNPEILIA